MEISKRTRIISSVGAAFFIVLASTAGFINIGWPPVLIVGGSATVAFVGWQLTYLKTRLIPALFCPSSC